MTTSSTASTARRTCTALSEDELQQVAQEVRELLIDTVGEIGGHFGANLGTCEIAVAVHSLLDSPRDKVLWDVGHQAYPHKVLTGRRDGSPRSASTAAWRPSARSPSPSTTSWAPGHASTSIGYAVGIKEAMRQGQAPDGKVVAVIGDGAMTGGVAFEAVSPGRRARHAAGRHPQRQRHVDLAQRRRAVALLQPRPARSGAVEGARGRRGEADQAARRHRRRLRAARPAAQGVREGVLGARAVVGGARLGLHGRHRRP